MKAARWVSVTMVAAAVTGLAACASSDDPADADSATQEVQGTQDSQDVEPTELNLVAFAVPKAANNAIQQAWGETEDGAGVTWVETYGASGDQSRAVEAGLEADYVHFSLEGDVTRLVDAGLVADTWNDGPTGGIVSSSVVVFAVREGNPKGIEDWDDLIREDVEIVTPNPGSSGSARWNLLAAWAYGLEQGGNDQAHEFTSALAQNIVALPGSGRDATTAFLAGTGDVLLSYENETILARQSGEPLDYVLPDTTLRIDNPGAVLIDADPKAQVWLDYLFTPDAQAEFSKLGFRPVVDGVDVGEVEGANDPTGPFPVPGNLFTIDDFGGWDQAGPEFFDTEEGIITTILSEAGKSS
ncbi:sulfate ABC transporter substrate-binding protein [Demequina sp.]|uniref:sulfate ABC transporter substrate-binding protein n=1 Tax=Demequina sp. TaxID=2050685 RepID=UPI003A8A9196